MSATWPVDLGEIPLYRGDAAGRNSVRPALLDDAGEPVSLLPFGDTWTAQAQVQDDTVIDLDVDASGAATGVLVISVPDESSADLPSSLLFDVQVTGGAISPLTVYTGLFVVDGEVTKP